MTAYTLLLDLRSFCTGRAAAQAGCPLPAFVPDAAFRRNTTADELYDTTVGLGRDAGHTYGAGDFVFAAPRFSASLCVRPSDLPLPPDELYRVDACAGLLVCTCTCNGSDGLNRSDAYAVSASAVTSIETLPLTASCLTLSPVELRREQRFVCRRRLVRCQRHVLMRNRNFVLRRDPYIANAVRARRRRLGMQERFDARAARAHNARPLNVVRRHHRLAGRRALSAHDDAARRACCERVEHDDVAHRLPLSTATTCSAGTRDQNQPAIYAGSVAVSQPHILARRAGRVLFGAARGGAPFQCDDLLWSRYAKLGYVTAEADCRCEIDDLLKYGRHLSQSALRRPQHHTRSSTSRVRATTFAGRCSLATRITGTRCARATTCACCHDTLRAYADLPVFASAYLEELHGARAGAFAQSRRPAVGRRRCEDARHMFEDSLVVFVSDHGLHFGQHLETLEGQIEHKLPLLHIAAPRWWLRAPSETPRLRCEHNEHTLTHHYDLHAMLEHLARIDEAYYDAHRDDGGLRRRHRRRPSAPCRCLSCRPPPRRRATSDALALAAYFAAESLPQRWPPQAAAPSRWLARLSLRPG
jgi:hypothetical protein